MFLDIGIGVLLSIWISRFFQTDLTLVLVLAGVFFALLPDADFFVEFVKHGNVGGKVIREHREITHFPLLYAPLFVLILVIFGAKWTALFVLSLLAHFLHDSVGIGWGIKWFWPFSKKSYKLFSEKNGRFSSRLFVSWDQKELVSAVADNGDPDWIKNIYLRPSLIAIIEFSGFAVSLLTLYLYLR